MSVTAFTKKKTAHLGGLFLCYLEKVTQNQQLSPASIIPMAS